VVLKNKLGRDWFFFLFHLWEGGRAAEVLDTCSPNCGGLACPIGPTFANHKSRWDSKGFSRLHPVLFRKFREDAAKLFAPLQGISGARRPRLPWCEQEKLDQTGPVLSAVLK
jgi:hypothetical protein